MKKEDAIKALKSKIDTMSDGAICCNYGNDKEVFEMAIKALEQEPKGKWIYVDDLLGKFQCSKCNDYHEYKYNYCPNCGASMRGKE